METNLQTPRISRTGLQDHHEAHENWLHQPTNHPESSDISGSPRRQQAQLSEDGQGLDDAQGPHDAHELHHPQAVGLLILRRSQALYETQSPGVDQAPWAPWGLISFDQFPDDSIRSIVQGNKVVQNSFNMDSHASIIFFSGMLHHVLRKAVTFLGDGNLYHPRVLADSSQQNGEEKQLKNVEAHQAGVEEVQIHDPLARIVDPLLSHSFDLGFAGDLTGAHKDPYASPHSKKTVSYCV